MNVVLVTFLRFAVSFGVTAISNKFVEMPFLRRKAHLRGIAGEKQSNVIDFVVLIREKEITK